MSSEDDENPAIPILLLKTKSQPVDTYEELLARPSDLADDKDDVNANRVSYRFEPIFVPVLEHSPVVPALSELEQKLENGQLNRQYGGMIFTSQRAVEAWAEVLHRAISRRANQEDTDAQSTRVSTNISQDPFSNLEDLTDFPLYVVGPATERILQALHDKYVSRGFESITLPFTRLRTSIHGAETGNGANLAAFILEHYNQLHAEHKFNCFEAPRLPFIPLLGMSSENYGRKRLDADDVRLRKRPLLFLVGETRRDIIPRTLQNQTDAKRIEVEEVEVYRTEVINDFNQSFKDVMVKVTEEGRPGGGLAIVVVFSPQGSEIMLKNIGYLDSEGRPTSEAQNGSWSDRNTSALIDGNESHNKFQWIVVSIGPTTRDYLRDSFGIEPDVCAEKPNSESLRRGIEDFLQRNNLS